MKMAHELPDAERRLMAWEANKHKYPNQAEWWRDFSLSPSHAQIKDEAQELIRKAADSIIAEELKAKEEAERSARRREAIYKSREAQALARD
jgi:hypothetical protein